VDDACILFVGQSSLAIAHRVNFPFKNLAVESVARFVEELGYYLRCFSVQ
jgi:hypothetical protein